MFNELAHSQNPSQAPSVALIDIWRVKADSSYDIFAGGRNGPFSVLIRTFGGSGLIQLKNGSKIQAIADTVFLIKYEDISRYSCPGSIWDFYWFEFNTQYMSALPFSRLLHIQITDEEKHLLARCFATLRKSHQTASTWASAIFSSLIGYYSYHLAGPIGDKAPVHKSVERAISLMYANPRTLTMEDLAKEAYLGERHFREVFTSVTGQSPKRFYNKLRLCLSENALLASSHSIGDIADRFGYSSQFHFSKAFKEEYGLSPLKYRKKIV